jgi:hypothetical protein
MGLKSNSIESLIRSVDVTTDMLLEEAIHNYITHKVIDDLSEDQCDLFCSLLKETNSFIIKI